MAAYTPAEFNAAVKASWSKPVPPLPRRADPVDVYTPDGLTFMHCTYDFTTDTYKEIPVSCCESSEACLDPAAEIKRLRKVQKRRKRAKRAERERAHMARVAEDALVAVAENHYGTASVEAARILLLLTRNL